MYTRPSNAHSLWFATALLPGGWANDVRIDVNAGRIAAVHVGVHALPNDERHAIGIPALGNVHSHAFQRALAGLTERREGADTFWSWREAMYALVARITPDQLEAIAAFAFMEMVQTRDPATIMAASFVGMVLVSFMFSPLASFLPELFATRVRVTGASLGFQFAGVFGGALAPIIATALIARFNSTTPVAIYLAVVCALIAVAAFAARETSRIDLKDAGR